GVTYRLDLPQGLQHNAFHASLLGLHYPKDNHQFPRCQSHQLPGFGQQPREWVVDCILLHMG
ncbi:hypothetical protein GY45DRAFT_1208441, partial [Cubamyces sp. BRFM 1775]